jgi:16S rRNA processing protein RimM
MLEYLIIGQLVNTHGVKGEMKATVLTDDPGRFKMLKWVYIDKNGTLEKYNIESVKFFKQFVILKFESINDIDAAQKLKGLYLKVDRAHAIKLPKNSYFITDLIGLQVYDENNILLGILQDIIQTGSNDVYIVRSGDGKEILIPALKSVVREIKIEEGKILVTLPEGLLD